jgi:hypothetical protein
MPRPSSRANKRAPVEHHTTDFGKWLLEDFPRFCKETRLIFPWYDQPILEMCAEMGFTELDETRKTQQKKLYLAPRGSWKTSLVIARIIFLLLKYPQIRLLLYRATRETAQQMLREVKGHLMSNTVILEHFGNLWEGSPKWDEDAIIISTRQIAPGDRDPSVMTIGVDGQTAGFHPDGVFMDDVVTEQNCDSPQLMDKAWRMMQSVYGLLQPWGWTLVTGTRWSNIDCYQKIIDINKACDEAEVPRGFEEYIRTVYITNPATGEQELFFPARLSQEFIDSQRNNPVLEARYFESWYFNRMVDPKAKPFKMGDLHFFDCEYSCFPYRYIKLTGDEFDGEEVEIYPTMTANTSSCAYGLSVCGFDANKNFMMLESKELIDVPSKADTVIFDLLLTYQPDLLIIESQGGDAALMTRIGAYIEKQNLKTRVVGYSALQDEVRGKRSKEQRINAMEPFVTQGYMWIRRGFCNELVRQMDLYPSLVRNDVIDSWAMLRHARKFIPDAKEFTRRKKEEGLEPDPYAITYYDTKLEKEVTVPWDTYHANPLPSKPDQSKVSRGCWTGRHLATR